MDLLYFLGVPGREVNVPAQEWSKLINQNFRFQLYLCGNPYGGRYSPDATYFRVVADDGNYYVLRHDEGQDSWTLDGFRAAREL